jgi:hypothetical protein
MVETKVSYRGLRPRLIAVWGLLLLLIGAIAVVELGDFGSSVGLSEARDSRALLPIPMDQVGAIEILHAGVLHRFERDPAGAWFYHGVHRAAQAAHPHQADAAMAKHIASAFAGLNRAQIERQLPLEQGGKEYGLTTPQMLILVYRPKEQQPLAQYAVGDVAPDTYSRYVMVVGRANVVTIANYQIDNLLALIKDASSAPSPALPAGKSSCVPAT